jgi:DNA-binding transcriptional LysR family regulator
MFFAREVLRTGGGIGALPTFIADGDLAGGLLARVLPRWVAPAGTVYLVHPSRRHVPRKVTVFRDLLFEMLRQRPLSAAVRNESAG